MTPTSGAAVHIIITQVVKAVHTGVAGLALAQRLLPGINDLEQAHRWATQRNGARNYQRPSKWTRGH